MTPDRPPTPAWMLLALGIVYGDLGTSPLYAMQTVVKTLGDTSEATVLGVLSLIVWALLIVISLKYSILAMRADNHGEGGILALMSLVTERRPRDWALIGIGLFGAALIYGDGAITPAISVLSALEGVTVVTDSLSRFVLPGALAILVVLFAGQTFGTAKIGKIFGPVMLLWFAAIAIIGAVGLAHHPSVLRAVSPTYGIALLFRHPAGSLAVLAGVFLVLTGGEALYADMGHVGRRPIRVAWLSIVLPSLLLSYAGQAAHLIGAKATDINPFWSAVPTSLVVPMVVLATLATIIASQAIITGAFSLTRQAMQLGWLPGVLIRQTSSEEYGQIYVPLVNWAMMVFTLGLTLAFGSSDRLAGAYGMAVSTTMLATTGLLYVAMVRVWHWNFAASVALAVGLFVVDTAFFVANLGKIAEGGWIPLVVGAVLFAAMVTWSTGIAAIRRRLSAIVMPPEKFLKQLVDGEIPRVPGTAVFLTRAEVTIPSVLVRHVADMGALQRKVATLAVTFEERPRVHAAERLRVHHVADSFWHLVAHYGFIEVPDLQAVLHEAVQHGCDLGLDDAVFFAARDSVVAAEGKRQLPSIVRMAFSFMYRNAARTVDRFRLPPERFVEVGRQIEL